MKYMLLIYGNDRTWDAMSAQGQAVYDAHRALRAEMEAAGELVAANGLTTIGARVVQLTDGVPAVTDGPFVEAKEVLAGYYLVECSLERATELAAKLPEARFSPIEVRAVMDPMPDEPTA
ncbi:YciI family protein [Kribbella sp. NPDC020789]